MAYMDQENKKRIAGLLKKEFGTSAKKRGFSYTLSVDNHSTLVMTISKGTIDFISNYIENYKKRVHPVDDYEKERSEQYIKELEKSNHLNVNVYHIDTSFTDECLDIMKRALKCLNDGNHNNSDIQRDYFDVGWYVTIQIGRWNKPYQLK